MLLSRVQVLAAVWASTLLVPSAQMSVRRQLQPDDGTDEPGSSAVGPPDGAPRVSGDDAVGTGQKDILSFPQPSLNEPGESITNESALNFIRDLTLSSSDDDIRTLMAVLHSLMSDGTLGPLTATVTRGNSANKRDGQIAGRVSQQVQGQLEEQMDTMVKGEVEVVPQQMAEFTLEPHLGPAILPFQVPEGYFVPFLPRRAFGVVNGVVRPPHGHGTFYVHRPPGLVDVPNSPAFGFLFSGYRRFDPEAPRTHHAFHTSPSSATEESASAGHGESLASADVEALLP
ncbi:uncharacterized protein LOC122254126 [Penaeus japonicus]|uniref:uncharacterized protein LOC122254126 n=1 Tax=Penaeus japonicus TaxID=27405 RepID=UPI001C70D5C0|nr:uncharacterized protein LOC122254126 [Penaeus japonicus]